MKHRLVALALFVGAVGLVQIAAAQPDPDAAFKYLDTNKDGKLSYDEFSKFAEKNAKLKGNPALTKQVFDQLDTNKDGYLSPEEFRKGAELKGKKLPDGPPAAVGGFNETPTAEQAAFFEKKIRPVLVDQCYKCHSAQAEKLKGGLLLDTRDGLRKGGDSGPVVVPGNPDRSPLIKAIRYADETTKMPPKAKLPDETIRDFEAWVKMGAPDPRATGDKLQGNAIDIAKGRQFWAFQGPKKVAPPAVKNAAWPASDVDRFILAALEAKGLTPVGDADRRTLIRRVYFDLTGLPPSPDEVEAFVADNSPQAFEKVVDRLLASPRFGERWARHWLDVARYAETTGKTVNFNYPHAWRYRDYVVAAFNADKPYDQFVREQLAGDLLATSDPKLKAERTIATGFLAIGPKALNERNGLQFELDVADEQIDVTSQAFLGITAACARCHDHKFDPIPQTDYYALAGIFRSTETCYGTVRFVQGNRPAPLIPLPKDCGLPYGTTERLPPAEREKVQKQITDLQSQSQNLQGDNVQIRRLFLNGQMSLLRSKLDSFEEDGTPKLLAMGVRDKPAGGPGFRPGPGPMGPMGPGGFGPFGGTRFVADSPVYARGEVDKPGQVVPRGLPQVMTTEPARIRSGSGRLELANWIASKDNPLTARVMVNRVWLHLFGRGLVPTPDNFGAAGQPPSNPRLLDYLAVTFAEDGWSVKKLIRRVVLSHAYQLDSRFDAKKHEADPDNDLIWRMTPQRLDAEAFRDSVLAVSGQLTADAPTGSAVARQGEGPTTGPRAGGPVVQGANDPRNTTRSIYLPVVRDNLPEVLSLFDAADPSLTVSERPVTTTPAQGLFLLNSPFVIRAADAAADELLKSTTTDSERIRAAYLKFYGRPPTDKELKDATEFLTKYRAAAARDGVPASRIEKETWSAFCQALFGSAEFQYRR
jgi:hypothetical protein